MFIQLTDLDTKKPVLVNVNLVTAIMPYEADSDTGTSLSISETDVYFVAEDFDTVSMKLSNRGLLK